MVNRFTRTVVVGNPREFTQTEKEEQKTVEGCNRLIKNSIIFWNYLYLTHKLAKMKDQKLKDALLKTIASHSGISWAHINILGEYDFAEEKLQDQLRILPLKLAA